VDFDGALDERGGALDGFHMDGSGIDDGLVGEVDALEFKAVPGWCGQDGDGDIFAGVEGASGEAGGGCESALVGHGCGCDFF
jgi:hypothetical protein